MKQKYKKIIIIVLIVLSLIGYGIYRIIYGPNVSTTSNITVQKYVKNYLTKKYGEHNYKITNIDYEYKMTTLFDYSNPTGYWVDFKSDNVSSSWLTIKGLDPNDFKVDSDYFIESYYFPNQDGYDVQKKMEDMKPKEELERIILNELRNKFDQNVYEVKCNTIILDVPEDYGKIPTLKDLQNNTNLYKVIQFEYKVLKTIDDKNEYEKNSKNI